MNNSSNFDMIGGLRILSDSITLSDVIKANMDEGLLESCQQMRRFVVRSLQNIAENGAGNNLDPQKCMGFWFNVLDIARHSGKVFDSRINIDFTKWDKRKWKATFAKQAVEYGNIFTDTGVQISVGENAVEITNTLYPVMFRAMFELQKVVRANKEKISRDNSFFYCDFRHLCENHTNEFTLTKIKPDIEDVIFDMLDDKEHELATEFILWLREIGLSPKLKPSRAVNADYKGKRVCELAFTPYRTKKNSKWSIRPIFAYTNEYENFIAKENLKAFHWSGIVPCCVCHPGTCGTGQDIAVFGRGFENICLNRGIVFCDPDEMAIENIKKIVNFRLASLAV
ncbi:MAG: hypothetical protein FWE06_09870 [Oscillospiraceae bacterium]|nr:hypothetical protein [Oscillospiraceae bacterium]